MRKMRSVIEQLKALEHAGEVDCKVSDRLMHAATQYAQQFGLPVPSTIFAAIELTTNERKRVEMTAKEQQYGVESEMKAAGCVCAWLDGVRYSNVRCPVNGHHGTPLQPEGFAFFLHDTEVPVTENMCLVLNGANEEIARFRSANAAQQYMDTLPVDGEYPAMMVLVMRVKGGAWPMEI